MHTLPALHPFSKLCVEINFIYPINRIVTTFLEIIISKMVSHEFMNIWTDSVSAIY